MSITEKEHQNLLNRIKELECELRIKTDKYEQEIKNQEIYFLSMLNRRNSALVNCRVFSALMFVFAFVSMYLHI